MGDRDSLLIRLVGEASGLDLDRQAAVAYVRMEATASHGVSFTEEEVVDALPCSEKRDAKGKRRAASFSWSALSPRSKKRLVEIAVECDFDGGAMHTAMSSLDLHCDPFEASEYLKNTLGDKNKRSLDLTKIGYADGGMSVRVTARGPTLPTDLVVFVIDVSSSMQTPVMNGERCSRESHVSNVMPDILSLIPDGTQVAQVVFSQDVNTSPVFRLVPGHRPRVVASFFSDRERLRGGCTDIFGGFQAAANLVASSTYRRALIVSLTDGEHNCNTRMQMYGKDPSCLASSINGLFDDIDCSVTRIGMSLSADATTMEDYVDTVLFAESGKELGNSFVSAVNSAMNVCFDGLTVTCSGGSTQPCCFSEFIAQMPYATPEQLHQHKFGASCSGTRVCIRSGKLGILNIEPIPAHAYDLACGRSFPVDLPEEGNSLVLVNGHVVLRDQKGIDHALVFYTDPRDNLHCLFDKPVVCNAPLYFDVHADLDKASFLVNDGRTMHELPPGSVECASVAEEVAYARRKWQGKYMEVIRSRTAVTRLALDEWMADAPDEKCQKMVQCQMELQELHAAGDASALNAACNYRSLAANEARSQSSHSQQHR